MPAIDTHQSVLDDCKALQSEEWEVLESIYPDCITKEASNGIITLDIPVELGSEREVSFVDDGSVPTTLEAQRETLPSLRLTTLPPLLLTVKLPQAYPLEFAPEIVSIHSTHSWLLRTDEVKGALLDMWQGGEGVLYTWIEWIRTAEFLALPVMVSSANGAINILHPAPHFLAQNLLSYNTSSQDTQFAHNSYTCDVCLTSHKGSRCLKLSCTHVFCRECLHDFWSLCITEGDVARVGCPHQECVKEGRQAEEEEVRRVVADEQVQRWKWLRAKLALEKDPSLLHCPLDFCQNPVPKPVIREGEESGWARLRTCGSCGYSFCSFCKRTWHGPISDCPISSTESLVLEYLALPDGSDGRLILERRFGKSNIAKLINKYEEECANKKYLEENTMACPGCQVHVQKSLGCNHMTCAKCAFHFCYRCGQRLDGANPYAHFSTPGGPCYSKLFDFTPSAEDGWQPMEGFAVIFE